MMETLELGITGLKHIDVTIIVEDENLAKAFEAFEFLRSTGFSYGQCKTHNGIRVQYLGRNDSDGQNWLVTLD